MAHEPVTHPALAGAVEETAASRAAAVVEDSPGGDAPNLRALLDEMIEHGASDLHITVGARAKLRIDGQITSARMDRVLGPRDTRAMAYSILTESQKKRFETEHALDFSFGIENLSRFRGNVYRQRASVAMALRRIPLNIQSFEELGLPPIIQRLAQRPRGLVLVTGPTGSGKSTTLAAMLDRINREQRGHILTVEDPIEFVHENRGCIVNQREVGADTPAFAAALKHALRQDPDYVLIGEMRDLETIQAALTISETGHLVFATLHTSSCAETIHRIVDVFPSVQQAQVRTQLAFVLEGVVTQFLVPRSNGHGRVAACEIMVCTPAIRACIRDEKVHHIYSIMQAGKKHGMQTLNDALYRLYLQREASLEECLQHARDPSELLRMVGQPMPA